MLHRARYTASAAGQAVTLTPIAAQESNPPQLAASTIVFNTVGNPAPTEFWKDTDEYIVTIERVTKFA